MTVPQIVLDTNVLIAAQRSRRGASSRLVSLMGTGKFGAHISVALALEYEDVLLRYRAELGLTADDVGSYETLVRPVKTPGLPYSTNGAISAAMPATNWYWNWPSPLDARTLSASIGETRWRRQHSVFAS